MKNFRQAVLAAACDGRLTEDWRLVNPDVEDVHRLMSQIQKTHSTLKSKRAGRLWGSGVVPNLRDEDIGKIPKTWFWTKVKNLNEDVELTVQIGPMSMKSKEFTDNGVPVLNVGCVQWGKI
jgi:type I restriction enzyme S subunit